MNPLQENQVYVAVDVVMGKTVTVLLVNLLLWLSLLYTFYMGKLDTSQSELSIFG